MSDQPNSNAGTSSVSPAVLRDTRWLAGGIWGALLLALVVTSWGAVTAGGAATSFSFLSFINLGASQNPDDMNPDLVATVALVLMAIVSALLVLAWTRFAAATMSLVSSLSDSSDDAEDQPATIYWLPTTPGARSELVDLLGVLGLAWAAIVLRPIVVAAVQIYSA
jgi:hypothetical protein